MSDKKIERVGLYFNMDEPDDKLMYEYLRKRNKTRCIKNFILNGIKSDGINIHVPVGVTKDDKFDDIDLNCDGIDLDD